MVSNLATTPLRPGGGGGFITPAKGYTIKKQYSYQTRACNCRRSRCLKKYCVCYTAGRVCGVSCKCIKGVCKNLVSTQVATTPPANALPGPCYCKKTRCLKRYCECFANNQACDGCKCTNCKNTKSTESEELTEYKGIWCRTTLKHFKLGAVPPVYNLTPDECGSLFPTPQSCGCRIKISKIRGGGRPAPHLTIAVVHAALL